LKKYFNLRGLVERRNGRQTASNAPSQDPNRKEILIISSLEIRDRVAKVKMFEMLVNLKPPADCQEKIIATTGTVLGEQNLEQRLTEIKAAIERMDFRWDQVPITDKADYIEKRLRLQQELEQLAPVEADLNVAADLLTNFPQRWADCHGEIETQHKLVKLILEHVYIQDNEVVAITLKSIFILSCGIKQKSQPFMRLTHLYTFGRGGARTPDLTDVNRAL
jgi:hypothetical protein